MIYIIFIIVKQSSEPSYPVYGSGVFTNIRTEMLHYRTRVIDLKKQSFVLIFNDSSLLETVSLL